MQIDYFAHINEWAVGLLITRGTYDWGTIY